MYSTHARYRMEPTTTFAHHLDALAIETSRSDPNVAVSGSIPWRYADLAAAIGPSGGAPDGSVEWRWLSAPSAGNGCACVATRRTWAMANEGSTHRRTIRRKRLGILLAIQALAFAAYVHP